jgi:hypothetical protein
LKPNFGCAGSHTRSSHYDPTERYDVVTLETRNQVKSSQYQFIPQIWKTHLLQAFKSVAVQDR